MKLEAEHKILRKTWACWDEEEEGRLLAEEEKGNEGLGSPISVISRAWLDMRKRGKKGSPEEARALSEVMVWFAKVMVDEVELNRCRTRADRDWGRGGGRSGGRGKSRDRGW
jgi:hypothetical protein